MTITEMRQLSDAELLVIANRKNKKGIHTREANLAMEVRMERSSHWAGIPTQAPKQERLEAAYNGYPQDWYD